jgi:hypothetical protein
VASLSIKSISPKRTQRTRRTSRSRYIDMGSLIIVNKVTGAMLARHMQVVQLQFFLCALRVLCGERLQELERWV